MHSQKAETGTRAAKRCPRAWAAPFALLLTQTAQILTPKSISHYNSRTLSSIDSVGVWHKLGAEAQEFASNWFFFWVLLLKLLLEYTMGSSGYPFLLTFFQ